MVASDDLDRETVASTFRSTVVVSQAKEVTTSLPTSMERTISVNWNNWKLCGREAETSQLEECYLRRKDHGLVLVTGELGIGKSALIDSLSQRVRDDAGVIVRGSFNVSQTEPYEAFAEAFTDLIQQLQLRSDYETVRSDIRHAIAESGTEWFLVSDGLAVLQTLMQDDGSVEGADLRKAGTSQENEYGITATDRQQGFVNAITKVVEAIGSVFPLVLVLENLMWADTGSVFLLESLCLTGKLSNVLLVATCRGDEVGFHDTLAIKLRSLEDNGVSLVDINLAPLSFEGVLDFIVALTAFRDDKMFVEGLAASIYSCTGGVPILICEVLEILQKDGLDSAILCKKLNFGDLIRTKIAQAPSSRQALQLMACLGGGSTHEVVLAKLLDVPVPTVNSLLKEAQQRELIVVNSDGNEYAFKHGHIQSVMYDFIPKEERSSIHYDIAKQLRYWLSEDQIGENIFLVLDQYRQGGDLIRQSEREDVARLCLVAAQKTARSAAISSAEGYIRFGQSLLAPRTKWRDYYQLALALTSAVSEIEFLSGNHDQVDILHREVLFHSRDPMDAVTSYVVSIGSLASRGRTKDAVTEGIKALESLGEKIPRRFMGVRLIVGFLDVKRILNRSSDEDFMALPLLRDRKVAAVAQIMALVIPHIISQQSPLGPIFAIRSVKKTCQYGLSPMTAISFAMLGLVNMMAFKDYEEAYRCARLTLKMMDIVDAPELKSRTLAGVYGFITTYKEPLRSVLKPLDDAFRLNILTGDVEMAILCKSCALGQSFQAGVPLHAVLARSRELQDVCELHNQQWNDQVLKITGQCALNFMGGADVENSFELTGELLTESTAEQEWIAEKNEVTLFWMYQFKLMLAVYICDEKISEQAKNIMKRKIMRKGANSFYTTRMVEFHEGMLCCFLASFAKTNRRRRVLISKAQRLLTSLQKFATICPQNFQNNALLLEAEIESLKNKKSRLDIVHMYREAASSAQKEGFLHEQGLALEKAGHYVRNGQKCPDDVSQARELFVEAKQVYETWGSLLKVNQLQDLLVQIDS